MFNFVRLFVFTWLPTNVDSTSTVTNSVSSNTTVLSYKKSNLVGSKTKGFGKTRDVSTQAKRSISRGRIFNVSPSPSVDGPLQNVNNQLDSTQETNSESNLLLNNSNNNIPTQNENNSNNNQTFNVIEEDNKKNLSIESNKMTSEEEEAAISYLKGQKLSQTQLNILSGKGASFWNMFKTNQKGKEKNMDIFISPKDSVIKATFFIKDEESHIVPGLVQNGGKKNLNKKKMNYVVNSVDVENLANETVEFSCLFTVVENDLNCNFKNLINGLKEKIWNDFLVNLYPNSCKLETIKVENMYPFDQSDFQKKRTYKSYGSITETTMKASNKPFAIVLSSDLIQSSRNDHQIKFLKLAVPENMSLKEFEKTELFSKTFDNLCTLLENPIEISKGLILHLTLETTRRGTPFRYWMVDNVLPLGFLNASKIYRLDESISLLKDSDNINSSNQEV